jgi:hypothetical protein
MRVFCVYLGPSTCRKGMGGFTPAVGFRRCSSPLMIGTRAMGRMVARRSPSCAPKVEATEVQALQ